MRRHFKKLHNMPGHLGPLSHCLKIWSCRGSNPGPHTCKACALPLSYNPSQKATRTAIFDGPNVGKYAGNNLTVQCQGHAFSCMHVKLSEKQSHFICCPLVIKASIAQWQSTGLVNQGSRVQSSLEALSF